MKKLKSSWLGVSKLIYETWRILTQALGSLKKLQLNGLFSSKVYSVWAEKVQGSYLSLHWRVMQNLKRIDLPVQNWHEDFNEFWPEHSKISKSCNLMNCFWPKYIIFVLRKYRWVMFNGTEYWHKIRRKTGLWIQKWE